MGYNDYKFMAVELTAEIIERLYSRFGDERPLNQKDQRAVRAWFGRELSDFWFLREIEGQFSLSLRAIPDSALITLGKGNKIPSDFLSRWEGFMRVYKSPEDILNKSPVRHFGVWKNPDYGREALQIGRLREDGSLTGVYSTCLGPYSQRLIEIAIINQWPGWRESPQPQFRLRVLRSDKSVIWQVGELDSSFQYQYREPMEEEKDRAELEVRGNSVHILARPILSEAAEFQLRVPLRYLPRVES